MQNNLITCNTGIHHLCNVNKTLPINGFSRQHYSNLHHNKIKSSHKQPLAYSLSGLMPENKQYLFCGFKPDPIKIHDIANIQYIIQ